MMIFKKWHFIICILLAVLVVSCRDDEYQDEPINLEIDNLAGVIEKGPFIQGSKVTLHELDVNLAQTGKSYTTYTTNSLGAFIFDSPLQFDCQFVEVETFGYFFNENAGTLSSSQIELRAVADISAKNTLNVNILTHLEHDRIIRLIRENHNFKKAKQQAERELLSCFNITQDINPADDISITDNTESSDILIAISSVMLYNKSEAEITRFLANFISDFTDNGVIDDEDIRIQIRNGQVNVKPDNIANNIKQYYEENNINFECGDLSDYINPNRYTNSGKKSYAARTVIVYMSAENNLSGYSNSDINELIAGSKLLNESQRLVLFVDNATTSQPAIIELIEGQRDTLKLYEKDFYASDPEKFKDVIELIERNCPAESYGLVLWGHAKGWLVERDSVAQSRPRRAYGVDNGSNLEAEYAFGNRWMNITQMARALEGLPKFRFIFADCCCMMCVEVAYELRHAADYLIGSPAEIPGNGAPYDKIAPLLFGQSDDFYRAIVDAYYDDYMGNVGYPGCSVPLSVADLSQMDQLAEATRVVLRAPSEYFTDQIAYYYCDKNDAPVMFDMCSLMERNLDENNYREWRTALDKAVPYRLFSQKWMTDTSHFDVYRGFATSIFTEDNYGGLSMFVAKPEYNFSPNYDFNRDIRQMSWWQAVGWSRFD